MNTVLFMLNSWSGENVGKEQMQTVPVINDILDIYGKGYMVKGRMYNCELECWILWVTKNN